MDAPDVEIIAIIGGKQLRISVTSEEKTRMIKKEAPDLESIDPPTVSFSDESMYAPDVEVIEMIGGQQLPMLLASDENSRMIKKEAPDLEIINPPTVRFSDEPMATPLDVEVIETGVKELSILVASASKQNSTEYNEGQDLEFIEVVDIKPSMVPAASDGLINVITRYIVSINVCRHYGVVNVVKGRKTSQVFCLAKLQENLNTHVVMIYIMYMLHGLLN